MTMHIITKAQVDPKDVEFSVSCTSSAITIARVGTDISVSLTLADLADYQGGAVVHWSKVYGFVLSDADSLINDKELDAYLAYARNVEKNVAAIVMNEAGTEAAAVFYAPISYDGDAILSDKSCSTAEAVEAVFPGSLERRMRFRNAKVELLRKVGAHDSLSALEKQVDLLTSLVVQLAQLVPAESRLTLASKLDQLLMGTGSNQGKDDDEVIEKVAQFKGLMRSCQSEYFARRDGAA